METELYKGYTIKIEQDDIGGDCREWDNTGTMVCRHRDYNLGDKQIPRSYYNEKLQCDVDIDTAKDLHYAEFLAEKGLVDVSWAF